MDIIEITQNTPFRFIMRKGTNSERLSCILSEGELGYTTDTQRVYIGDGQTYGGNIVGNNFITLSSTTLTSSMLSNAEDYDLIYITQTKTLYYYLNNTCNEINIINNVKYDNNVFSVTNKGLTLKESGVKNTYNGPFNYIVVDNYGRLVNVTNE